MVLRNFVRICAATLVVVVANVASAAFYMFDDYQATTLASGQEFMVDAYGITPTGQTLVHGADPYAWHQSNPELGFTVWRYNKGINAPGIIGAQGHVYTRTNGGTWKYVKTLTGVLQP